MIKRVLLFASLFVALSAGLAAQDIKKEMAQGGKVTVIITHEVKDYASWRKAFDTDESNRKMGGFSVQGVYADAKNPNTVTIIGTFPDAAAVEKFVSSPKLKEAMENGGVMGKPEVKVLTALSK
jgi:quinol monooxygenase YgiN